MSFFSVSTKNDVGEAQLQPLIVISTLVISLTKDVHWTIEDLDSNIVDRQCSSVCPPAPPWSFMPLSYCIPSLSLKKHFFFKAVLYLTAYPYVQDPVHMKIVDAVDE